MLPTHIDENETYKFVIDDRNPLCVVLATKEMFLVNGPVEPLWHREAADERSMRALIRWIGVRRDRWQEWGELAEALGHEAFYQHMRDRMKAEPIAQCTATVVQRQDDPQDIVMGEMMHGANGIHLEELYRHSFATAQARDAFYAWFFTDENWNLAEPLLQIGYSKGTAALGVVLDEIAAENDAPLSRAERRRRAKTASKMAA